MIKRILEIKTKKLARYFPVISVTGPRQSGKTTLIKKCFPNYTYLNLEDPIKRALIEEDPTQFINKDNLYIIIDEIQKIPELLSYIQIIVDDINKPGLFIISGSENLIISEKISQSLAGRVGIINLFPFSLNEIEYEGLNEDDAFSQIIKGFYPRIYDQNIPSREFYSNYISTYVERDIRQIKNIGNIANFQKFMQIIAGRVGQILNLASISNDIGVDNKTISSWLSILEATFITFRLYPYFKNYGKRVIKSPKLYFYDTGILSYLLGIDNQTEMSTHFAKGSLFENLVIADIVKTISNLQLNIKPYFWRDNTGHEIDLILDKGNLLDSIEIKSSKIYKLETNKNFLYWNNIKKEISTKNHIIYNGDIETKIKGCNLINWKNASQKLVK